MGFRFWKVFTVGAAVIYGLTSRTSDSGAHGYAAAKTIYLARHAEAEHNVHLRYNIRDPHLTELGRHQAEVELPEKLRNLLRIVPVERADMERVAEMYEKGTGQPPPMPVAAQVHLQSAKDPADLVQDSRLQTVLELEEQQTPLDEKEIALENKSQEIRSKVVGHGPESVASGTDESSIDLIVTSPLKRTIQTCLLGYKHYIDKGVKVTVLPDLQEIGALPADTGSPISELKAEFPQLSFEHLEKIEEANGGRPWFEKNGNYSTSILAVIRRTHRVVNWLLEQPETEIAVVTHNGFLQLMLKKIKVFRNAEVRKYTLTHDRRWKHEILLQEEEVMDETITREMEELEKREI